MTTTITIEAHVSEEKNVLVSIINKSTCATVEEFTMQNGEKASRVVYDDREITVSEVSK